MSNLDRPGPRRPLPADRAHRRRRHGRGVAGPGRGARPRGRGEDPAPGVRRRPDLPRAVPRRGTPRRDLSHPSIAAVYDSATARGRLGSRRSSSWSMCPASRCRPMVARREPCRRTGPWTSSARPRSGCRPRTTPGSSIVTSSPATSSSPPTARSSITDFGIARATDSVPLTQTGAIMGTAYYISPEQASGESVTPASDVYSLGIVAYECLTGRRPFDGNTPVSVALAQVSEEPPALPGGPAVAGARPW